MFPEVLVTAATSSHLFSLLYREQAIIDVFERTTYSVVNVFDITLQVSIHCSPLEKHAACIAVKSVTYLMTEAQWHNPTGPRKPS